MLRSFLIVLSLLLLGYMNPTQLNAAVTFQWANIGNVGNAADPMHSGSIPGIGSVGYAYNISKYQVTNAQYTEFLNAVDPIGSNTRALYNGSMDSDPHGGITFISGNPDGSKYAVKGDRGNRPVVDVSWYDAARMANWLHNGQGAGSTESGVYTMIDNTTVSGGRSANATFFIPTENEWYKAAFHQPAAAGGDVDDYWLYPAGSNSNMIPEPPPGGPNSANFRLNPSEPGVGTASDVGAYTAADSYYGTFDQAGNVWEWTEMPRGFGLTLRGGSWSTLSNTLRSGNFLIDIPGKEQNDIGFRLAGIIPEPGAVSLLAVAALGLARRRMRR